MKHAAKLLLAATVLSTSLFAMSERKFDGVYPYTGKPVVIGKASIGPDAGVYSTPEGVFRIAQQSAKIKVEHLSYTLGDEKSLKVHTEPEGLDTEILFGPENASMPLTWEIGSKNAPTKPGTYSISVRVVSKNFCGEWIGINALQVLPPPRNP